MKIRNDLSIRGGLGRLTLALLIFACFLAILLEILAAEGYDRNTLPAVGCWAWVFFGLIVLPAVYVCMFISGVIMSQLGVRSINNAWRRYSAIMLLDMFLWILKEIQSRSHQLDLERRVALSQSLEWGARRFSRDFLPSVALKDIASGDWLRRRSEGWAEALRHMQREVIAPVPGGQPRLEAKLRHEIQCLATGNLGALPWRQPPPLPSRRTALARNLIEILRTVLVAALPIGAVLAGQAILHFSSAAFRWASIATGVWALLYVVISLDPAIRDKIDTARSLVDTLHEARRS